MLQESVGVREMVVQNSVEGYWRLDGKLSEDSFNEAMSLLANRAAEENPLTVRNSSLQQAQHMAEFSKVPITKDQEFLYAALREKTNDTSKTPNSSTEKYGVEPWALTDQCLMAEVLLATNDWAKYDDFKKVYPNIFEQSSS